MLFPRNQPRLAPLGPGPAAPAGPALGLPEVLGPLREAVTDGGSVLAASWANRLRLTFPGPGQAVAAAGVVLASATLATLGLVASGATVPDVAGAVARPAVARLLASGSAVAVLPPPPLGPDGGGDRPSTGDVPPAADRMSRLSVTERPAPPAPTPEPAPEPPAAVADPLRLSRLSRSEVLAAVPPPETLARLASIAGEAEPVVPADAGALPLGKGMWLYVPEEVEGGNVDALVARAQQVGLTHVYVRTGSSRSGFYAGPYLDELLPKAHAAGIRVYGWDFPYLEDIGVDVSRSVEAIAYTTPSGDRIDGFAADIETSSEGTNLSAEGAAAYSQQLREAVGSAYPLVAVVPRPSPQMQQRYPYSEVIPPYDAVAPMTYWLNRQPDSDVINDVTFLASFGKPVIPVGQAYDGAPEGGRPGPPPPEEIQRFLTAAQQVGAAGTSFWSWQHASQAIWDTIEAAPEFRWSPGTPDELRPEQVRALQAQLAKRGHPVAATGSWDDATGHALGEYQESARLPRTGILDPATVTVLLEPFNPPIG